MRAIIDVAFTARDRALVFFLADTLARVGGVCHLKIEDLDLDAGQAFVHEKGQEAREVYLSGRAVDALRDWLKERPAVEHDFVFTSEKTSRPLKEGGVFQAIERLAKSARRYREVWAASVETRRPRNMIQNGAPLSVVAQILGHADIGVTWRFYAQLGGPQLQKAHAEYGHSWSEVQA